MSTSVDEEILAYIRRNKVSTTEIADCLGKTGVVEDVYPINRGHFRAGKIRWVYGYDESNWDIHMQVRDVQPREIIFVETFDCKKRAVFGELVTKYIITYQGAEAVVTDGYMRDAHRLIKENYPVWCKGVTPIGCFNRQSDRPMDEDIIRDRRERLDGAIMVCDDSGVVIIPKDQINQEFLKKLEYIEWQEDTWFDCIDRKKWNTYDTVCLKKYLEE